MTELLGLYGAHPFWVWAAVGAILLAAEVATGSGYLLWPAACALVVAIVGLFARISLAGEVMLFAVLTLVSTIAARRYLPKPFHAHSADINDPLKSLVGHTGQATHAFAEGHGRVFIDGKEWAAEMEGGGHISVGSRVEVVGMRGGACLRVRAA